MPQIKLGKFIHTVTTLTCGKGIGHQHRVLNRVNLNLALPKNLQIKFCILQNFHNGCILQKWLEPRQNIRLSKLRWHIIGESKSFTNTMREWNIAGMPRAGGK